MFGKYWAGLLCCCMSRLPFIQRREVSHPNCQRFITQSNRQQILGSTGGSPNNRDAYVVFFLPPPDQAFIHEDEEYTRSLPPNPFGNLTERELNEYKNTVERKQQGQEGLSHR